METPGFRPFANALALGTILVALSACSQRQQDTDVAVHDRQARTLARNVYHARNAQPLTLPTGVVSGPGAPGASVTAASWPDRGELTTYVPGSPTRKQGAYAWHPVRLSEAHAFRSITTGEMKLRAPNGELLTLKYDRHVEHPSGDWSWIGRVEGAKDGLGQAIVTFGSHAVFGEIAQTTARTPPLRIATRAGSTWIGETTYAALQANASRPAGPDVLFPPKRERKPNVQASAAAQANALPAALAVPPTVDLLIGYTPGVVQELGNTSAVVTRMNYHIDFNNLILANSGVNGRLRLVHTALVNYADNTDMYEALYDLTGEPAGRPVPASLQPLHALRDQLGADLVSLVRRGGCGGVAWMGGGGQTPIDASDAVYGFSTVFEPGCDDGLVIPHELGHNFGIDHDLATNGGGRGGAYTYSLGYRTTASDGALTADVMAYTDGHTKYNFYSNPNVIVHGSPLGSAADGDGARTLNNTFPLIANYRRTVIFNGVRARQDVSGDARSDLLFVNPSASYWAHWRMNGGTVVATPAGRAYAPGNQLVASGDFNGDGRTDHVWMTPGRKLWLWRSNGTVMTAAAIETPALGAQWSVVGAADVTGNGRAKLLFFNAGARTFTFWSLDGTRPTYTASLAVPAGHRLVATGDFNADGQQDLVWKDGAGTMWVWWTNTSPINAAIRRLPSANGWIVLGAGDVTGDRKADLMFFNPQSRQFTYWIMSGSGYVRSGPRITLGSGWTFATSGDLNGDGRTDLVWRNGTRLEAWLRVHPSPQGTPIARQISTAWRVYNGIGGG